MAWLAPVGFDLGSGGIWYLRKCTAMQELCRVSALFERNEACVQY